MTCFIYLVLVLLLVSLEESIAFFAQKQPFPYELDGRVDGVAWTNGTSVFYGLGTTSRFANWGYIWASHNGQKEWNYVGALSGLEYGHVKGAAALSFQGAQYIFGGRDPVLGCSLTDSTNIWMFPPSRSNWVVDTQTSTGKWGRRAYQMAVVWTPPPYYRLPQYILLIGGTRCNEGQFNDVWMFSGSGFGGGSSWTKPNNPSPFGARAAGGITAIQQGSVVIIAGGAGNGNMWNDVWQSVFAFDVPEFLTWRRVCTSAPWSPRTATLVSTTNDYLYLINGANWGVLLSNDVWVSPDGGYTWLALAVADSFSARTGASLVAVGRLLVLMGGGTTNSVFLNDIWTGWGV